MINMYKLTSIKRVPSTYPISKTQYEYMITGPNSDIIGTYFGSRVEALEHAKKVVAKTNARLVEIMGVGNVNIM